MYEFFVPGQHKEKEPYYLDCFQNERTFYPHFTRESNITLREENKGHFSYACSSFFLKQGFD